MIAYTKGSQAGRSDSFAARAKNIKVKALSGTLAVHADGETICEAGKELEITNHKHALRIIE
jgi:hypothetical protein